MNRPCMSLSTVRQGESIFFLDGAMDAVAVAEILYWALLGAIIPLGYVVLRANTHDRRVGLTGALAIPVMLAPLSALCGAAAL